MLSIVVNHMDNIVMKKRYPLSYRKACYVRWGHDIMGWSQTQIAIMVGLNVGTVNHVVYRRRFPDAVPVPIPGFRA